MTRGAESRSAVSQVDDTLRGETGCGGRESNERPSQLRLEPGDEGFILKTAPRGTRSTKTPGNNPGTTFPAPKIRAAIGQSGSNTT